MSMLCEDACVSVLCEGVRVHVRCCVRVTERACMKVHV